MLKTEYIDAVTNSENAITGSIDAGLCPGCSDCESAYGVYGDEFLRAYETGEISDEGFTTLSDCDCCMRSFDGYHTEYAAHGMDDDGIVHYDICEDCRDYLTDGTLPDLPEWEIQDKDLVITDCGPLGANTSLGYYNGKHIGVFVNDKDAIAGAIARMNRDKCWPNVWRMSDHGNLSLVEL